MIASVLNTPVAIEASVRVVRAFVKMREFLAKHEVLGKKLDELERRVDSHDGQLQELFAAIRQLIAPVEPPRRRIGFRP